MSNDNRETMTLSSSDVQSLSASELGLDSAEGHFDIADLKTRHLSAFFELNDITPETEGGRHMLMSRFVDELEDNWNLEHRDELRKTNCEKLFTADDVRRYAGITEDGVAENAPVPLQDRAAFAEFLDAGGAG